MGFIYSLAVVLVLTERIIIQCEGARGAWGTTFRDRLPNAQLDNIKEKIVCITDFRTIKCTANCVKSLSEDPLIAKILEERLIIIEKGFVNGFSENYYLGETFLNFEDHLILDEFLLEAGDQVKKIEIYVWNDIHKRMRQNIIKNYAENLEELRIIVYDDERFWEDILENGITFPEVNKVQILGESSRKDFKLNLIFPTITIFELYGRVADVNCLKNVYTLNELTLHTDSIQEDQLEHIFQNNQNLTKISLFKPQKRETKIWIATYLTELKTLKLESPCRKFLSKKYDGLVHELPNVENFDISFSGSDSNFKSQNFTFAMPKLRKITLDTVATDINRIIQFIITFEKLQILEITLRKVESHEYDSDTFYHPYMFISLIKILESFDENLEFQTLKFVNFPDGYYEVFEKTMKERNIVLSSSGKPIWTSHAEQFGIGKGYFMLRRESLKSSKQ